MIFEDLNKQVVAVRAKDIDFDYFSRKFTISITPEYGYEKALEGKRFKIDIGNCVYFCGANTSKMASSMQEAEFVVWGKHREEECNESCNELIDKLLSTTPSAATSKDFMLKKKLDKQYFHYFFQGIMGDAIDILAAEDSVTEISK